MALTAGPFQRVPSRLTTVRTDLPRPRWFQDHAGSTSCNLKNGGDGRRGTRTDLNATGEGGQTDHTRSGDTVGGGRQRHFVSMKGEGDLGEYIICQLFFSLRFVSAPA